MIGAAIFQSKFYDPFGINPGFRCLSGKPPESFTGTGELSSNVRWLTNISVESAFNSQLKNTPRLLDDKYLRVATSSIILELGLKSRSIEEQSKCISHVFNNVMKLAKNYFNLVDPPFGSLASGITPVIGHAQPQVKDKLILAASQKAILQFTSCERKINPNSRVEYVSLVIPRVKHADYILKAGWPCDDFFWLAENQLPSKELRLKWVVESNLPMLCKIKVNSISREFNHLINWGNGAGSFNTKTNSSAAIKTRNKREYATSNEIKLLSLFCDIEIEEVALSNTPAETSVFLPEVGGMTDLSYSYGVLVENLWCALLRDLTGKYVHTPMTAWIHSNDRIACLKYAKRLSDKGFVVNGYGYGRITLAIETQRKDELKKVAIELGLLPYLDLDILDDEIDITEAKSNEELLKLLYSCGHLPFILQIDDAQVTEALKQNGK